MINVNKVFKRLKKELGKNITLEVLEGALRRRGYTLLFINSPDGQAQLRNLDLLEYAAKKKAFTVCTVIRIVFIDDAQHENDLIKLALHELAHIDLGHLDNNELKIHDDVSAEIEANAVVYKILSNEDSFALRIPLLLSLILLMLSLSSNVYMHQKVMVPAAASITNQPGPITKVADIVTDEGVSESDTVYVTPTGNKYHRMDCQYINIERARAVARSLVEADYTPCKVCRP